MLRSTIITGLALSLTSFSASAETTGAATVAVWKVRAAERPPFELQRIEIPAVEAARFEEEPPMESVTVRKADYTGRPLFRRSYRDDPIMDSASLEPDFGPGPELVTPNPKPFHQLRYR